MADYWKKRQVETYKVGEMKVSQYFTKLERAFNQTRRELQKTIESFYFRYAEENRLSYAAAQIRLNKEELGELQDFIDLSMKNIGRYSQTVNNMSIKARITRHQALEAQIDAMLRELYAIDYQDVAEQTMREVYRESYYQTWYNIDQYHGFHSAFAQVDPTAIEELLKYPFNGANFSSRLWKQKDHLQAQLMESITTMMVQGKNPQVLAADFAKKMNAKKFDAYRLLHTESSFLMSEAAHTGYKADGVEKYQILSTLDSKTCGICGDKDGDVHEVDKAIVGKNMPPFHCFCRCTDVPYYDDDDLSGEMRVARDPETGKTVEVPADMTYKEWKQKFIIEKKAEPDIMKSGAMKGALTDKNDPLYIKREKHAQSYYQAVRNSKKTVIVKTISDNTNMREKYISRVYDHVFINEYDLYGGSRRFDPDYDMAESFRRLREGRDIQNHDVVLLQHEHLEYGLMNKLGMPYDEAHRLAESKYNYWEALNNFKKSKNL